MFGYIYKCTYLKNNKIYIGASKKLDTINTYLGSSRYWIREVDPYHHRDQIKKEILEYVDTREQLYDREEYWISYYNSTDPTIGYNLAKGGRHAWVVSEESKKIRDQHDSETMSRLMKTTDLPQKISKGLKKYKQEHGVSEEHKRKISEALKGRNVGCNGDTRSTSLLCIVNNKEEYMFHSKREASLWYYENYPFSNKYSETTYTRAINASIANTTFTYKHKNVISSDLQWSFLETDSNQAVYCIYKDKEYHFDNKDLAAQWWHKTYPLSNESYNKLRYIFKITSNIKGTQINYNGCIFNDIQWFEERRD